MGDAKHIASVLLSMKGLLFNPSHDDALASGRADYCPTRIVRRMETDLSLLPLWWADPDSVVLTRRKEQALAFCEDNQVFLPEAHVASFDCAEEVTSIAPWGWDAHIVRCLESAGFAPHLLPSSEQLEQLRRLSSRYTSVRVLRLVREQLNDSCFVGESYWVEQGSQLKELLNRFGRLMVKAPWSCSGRGVFELAADDKRSWDRALSVVRRQGAIEAEPFYERVADFAMEYESDGMGHVAFRGLSWFGALAGRYVGNCVCSEARAEQEWQRFLPIEILWRTRQELLSVLENEVAASYRGPLGVDIMVCRDAVDGHLVLHPCIEVNVRHTMGLVAIDLRRLLPQNAIARFSIMAERTSVLLQEKIQKSIADCPLVHSNGLITQGVLALTPVLDDTQFVAVLQVRGENGF